MKYSEEIVNEIVGYVKEGLMYKDAYELAGISETTFYEWKKKYKEFAEALKKAEPHLKRKNLMLIQKHADKTWQASAWILERRFPEEFGNKDKEVSNNQPVIQVVVPKERVNDVQENIQQENITIIDSDQADN